MRVPRSRSVQDAHPRHNHHGVSGSLATRRRLFRSLQDLTVQQFSKKATRTASAVKVSRGFTLAGVGGREASWATLGQAVSCQGSMAFDGAESASERQQLKR